MRNGLQCFYMWSLLLQKMLSNEVIQQIIMFSQLCLASVCATADPPSEAKTLYLNKCQNNISLISCLMSHLWLARTFVLFSKWKHSKSIANPLPPAMAPRVPKNKIEVHFSGFFQSCLTFGKKKKKKKKDKPKIFIWHTRAVLGHSFLTGPSKIIQLSQMSEGSNQPDGLTWLKRVELQCQKYTRQGCGLLPSQLSLIPHNKCLSIIKPGAEKRNHAFQHNS